MSENNVIWSVRDAIKNSSVNEGNKYESLSSFPEVWPYPYYNTIFKLQIYWVMSARGSQNYGVLTEMGMLDCADLCCQVTNRFSIFICFSSSVSTETKPLQPLSSGDFQGFIEQKS